MLELIRFATADATGFLGTLFFTFLFWMIALSLINALKFPGKK